jgi:hypothetical protein
VAIRTKKPISNPEKMTHKASAQSATELPSRERKTSWFEVMPLAAREFTSRCAMASAGWLADESAIH